jgi:YHS domain-containing protein
MKTTRYILGLTVLTLGLAVAPQGFAAEGKKHSHDTSAPAKAAGTLTKVTKADAAWVAKARESYPLKVCVTSDEKLGSMGDNAEYIYREKGKPDRLVMFCCEGCEEDFLKNPPKYLAKIDAAAKTAVKKK